MQYDENAEKYGYEGEMTPLKCDERVPPAQQALHQQGREMDGQGGNEMKQYKAWELLPEEKVYLKYEADKVIAELKAQKAQAEDDCAYWKMNEGNAANAMRETEEYAMQLYNELRHQKYRRCLAMAERCKYRMYYLAAVVEQETSKIIQLKAQIRRYEKLERRMDYWKNRWLELAEKFKPNKEADDGND